MQQKNYNKEKRNNNNCNNNSKMVTVIWNKIKVQFRPQKVFLAASIRISYVLCY